MKRPKLKVTGGGGGGGVGQGFYASYVTISNKPGLLGLSIPPTKIFGFRVHRHIEWGLVVDRTPAHECHAVLYDKETAQVVKPLWWRGADGSFSRKVTLQFGKSASLMLFARHHDEPLKYFVFQPKNENEKEILVPSEHEIFDTTRHFYVQITHSYGKKKLRTEVAVISGFDGRLSFRHAGGGGSF